MDLLRQKRQCEHIKEDGSRCRAWALHGGQLCRLHSIPAEERSEFARQLAATRHEQIREQKALDAKRKRPQPDPVTVRLATDWIKELLRATLDGHEPDFGQRALGLELLTRHFDVPPEWVMEGLRWPERDREIARRRLVAAQAEVAMLVEQGLIDAGDIPHELLRAPRRVVTRSEPVEPPTEPDDQEEIAAFEEHAVEELRDVYQRGHAAPSCAPVAPTWPQT